MMRDSPNPPVLYVVDDDFAYGINHGYYPEINTDNLCIVGCEALKKDPQRYEISGVVLHDKKDVFIRNPYTNLYYRTNDPELMNKFFEDKMLYVRDALVMMGAKNILLTEDIKDKDSLKVKGGHSTDLKGKKVKVQGSLNTSFTKDASFETKRSIESSDPERKPCDPEKVKAFLQDHGLAKETNLNLYCDRLRDGRLSGGTEQYELTYFTEISNALNILSAVKWEVFGDGAATLDFTREHNHIHKISFSLRVEF